MRAFSARVVAAVRILVRDDRIPRWLRWVTGISLLPIPGPVDEAVLLLVAPVLFVLYRGPLRDAWREAG